ncbi:MAG: ATP-dependent helicase [Nakamurella sp.]
MTPDQDPDSGAILRAAGFSDLVAEWFGRSFAAPTPAQLGAWESIRRGDHTLVVAPTGSGKTLAAFLSAIDRLVVAKATAPAVVVPRRGARGSVATAERDEAAAAAAGRCRVLYLSPLKALAVDVERNLRAPLTGIAVQAQLQGQPVPEIAVAVRSGDTSTEERRQFGKAGADILITTPESLFLILTSRAREMLAGVETVIIDEVHAVAGTKRGAHLALSLARLDALLERPAQRIGLSATVRPLEEVGRFLTGGMPVTMVQPPASKKIDVDVVIPVADLTALGQPTGDLTGTAAGDVARTSIWPHVEERIVDLIGEHRSTIVFANSRRLAERLTARLNEIHGERLLAAESAASAEPAPSDGFPTLMPGGSGLTAGASPILAKAHHGSVSRSQRAIVEDELKSGLLPAVVATSSLELGIDMGAVDLVIQVETPPSVASGLQRVGRAGHQVGAVSRGVMFPKYRGDLVSSAVVSERMTAGAVEALAVVANPLDVLAQHIVSIVAMDPITVDELHELVRRSAPYASLPRSVLEAVLDMLSGRYPSEEFAELRPRLVWDRGSGELTGRPGAQRLAITSGGTIPDRGMFGVFLAGGEGPGRRVGELDEEMVYESRVGDVFALGSTSWMITEITHDRVLVLPAPGRPGRLPFWKGDGLGRPAELGRAHGAFLREIGQVSDPEARVRLTAAGLDTWAADNLLSYLAEQRQATGTLPDEKTIIVERFRDELGDWRVVLHSPFGAAVHAPWALAVAARMRERFGIDVQAMHADDGIVFRLPDLEFEGGAPEIGDLVVLEPDELERDITAELGGSAVFAARFRECAARALLLPRRQIGRRQPLWQQRQRASQLLEVAARYPTFPIIAETIREVLQDVFDVPGLIEIMKQIAGRAVRVIEVETPSPSPFAQSLLFGYVAQFLYEGDSPLAERRAAALAVDPALLADLLGHGDGLALRDLLDPEAIERTELELQRLAEGRRARSAEEAVDLLRVLGPLSALEIADRSTDPDAVPVWLTALLDARRIVDVRVAGDGRYCEPSDVAALRDGLGVNVPLGVAQAFLERVGDPLLQLLGRWSRVRGPFTAADAAARFGLGPAVAGDVLKRLVGSGRLVQGEFRPTGSGGIEGSVEYVDAEVLRLLRRRSLASLRAEVEPVPPAAFARFLPAWNGIGPSARKEDRLRGADGLLRCIEQLAGVMVPASALETLVLPARLAGYTPALLDELMAAGEVIWAGHAALAKDDGWVSLHLTDAAPLTLPLPAGARDEPDPKVLGDIHAAVLEVLAGGGAYFFRPLSEAVALRVGHVDDAKLVEVMWDLVFAAQVTGDTLTPVRARLAGGKTTHRQRPTAPRSRLRGMGLSRASLSAATARPAPATVAGRWSLVPAIDTDPTVRAHATAEILLDRYGVVTRGSVVAEEIPGNFAGVYRVLSAFEEAGRTRRGYFIEGLGAAQFASTGAVDRLRGFVRIPGSELLGDGTEPAVVLAAADPANPYGAALPWPEVMAEEKHRPARRAGAMVALVDGEIALYAERGGRSLLSFTADADILASAARGFAAAVTRGGLGSMTVQKVNGGEALAGAGSPVAVALEAAGFSATPRGLRLRPAVR